MQEDLKSSDIIFVVKLARCFVNVARSRHQEQIKKLFLSLICFYELPVNSW